jgi:hypothetical protein
MQKDSPRPARREQRDDKAQHTEKQRSGEGAASALASMKEQLKQQRRDEGKSTDEPVTGGPS